MSRVCSIRELIEILENIENQFGDVDVYDRSGCANNVVEFLKSGTFASGTCLVIGAVSHESLIHVPATSETTTTRMLSETSERSMSSFHA